MYLIENKAISTHTINDVSQKVKSGNTSNVVFVTFDNNQERLRKIKDYITCIETNVFRIGGINHQIKRTPQKNLLHFSFDVGLIFWFGGVLRNCDSSIKDMTLLNCFCTFWCSR